MNGRKFLPTAICVAALLASARPAYLAAGGGWDGALAFASMALAFAAIVLVAAVFWPARATSTGHEGRRR